MRTVIFGVDGLSFRVLHPLIKRGELPNFARLQREGVEAEFISAVPAVTPPAWMSLTTGLKPAKHGVYDFWEFDTNSPTLKSRAVTHRKGGKAIWNILSEYGKRVIVMNVPLTYPPEPVNGVMLSGLMAPNMEVTVTYPAEFQEELLQVVPNYQIDLEPAVDGGQTGDLIAETLKMTQNRIAMLRLLLQKPWDFFFIVFTGADRIQHGRWHEVMKFHPQAVAYY